MSAKDVADMRLRNNNIEVRRISDGKASNVNDRYYIPNPIETFEQAFHVSTILKVQDLTVIV